MRRSFGFTLVELMVVASIISLLAGATYFYAQQTSQKSRDQKRQSDIRLLQAAVEQYKLDNGRYPAGCNGTEWSGELGGAYQCSGGNSQYIVGLAPTYIPSLPRDPKRDSGEAGYAYLTNTDGTVYKIVARGTVESELVDYRNPMKSCDISPAGTGDVPSLVRTTVEVEGLCSRLWSNGNTVAHPHAASMNNHPSNLACNVRNTNQNAFRYTYGVWGGFAPLTRTTRNVTGVDGRPGAQSICSDYLGITESPLKNVIYCNDSRPVSDNIAHNSTVSQSIGNAFELIIATAISGTTDVICR